MWWQFRTGPELSRWGLIALAALLAFCIAACEGEEEPPSTLGPSPTLPASATPSAQSPELPTATPAGLLPVPTLPPPAVFSSPEELLLDFWEPLAGNCMEVSEEDLGKYCYQLSEAQHWPIVTPEGPQPYLHLKYNIGLVINEPHVLLPSIAYRYCQTVKADGEGSWMLVPKGLVGHQCEPYQHPQRNYESARAALLNSWEHYPRYRIKGDCQEMPTPAGHPPPPAEPLACYEFHQEKDGFWYYDVTKYPFTVAPSACITLYNQGRWWIVQECIDEPCE